MSIVTMDMSEYKFERDDSIEAGCGRVICAEMIPSLALQQYTQTGERHPAAMPLSLVSVDAGLFLKKMYAYQR